MRLERGEPRAEAGVRPRGGNSSGALSRCLGAVCLLFGALGAGITLLGMRGTPVHRPEGEGPSVLGLFQSGFPGPQQRRPAVGSAVGALTDEHLPCLKNASVGADDFAPREAWSDSGNAFQFKLLLSSII